MTLRQQVVRFSVVGFTCTILYMVFFWAMREIGIHAQIANFVSMLSTAIISNALNRRFTFGAKGRENFWKHHTQSLIVFLFGLGVTSLALALLNYFLGDVSTVAETFLATAANLSATVFRFYGMRKWVFKKHIDPLRSE